jgi:hypothetical protein
VMMMMMMMMMIMIMIMMIILSNVYVKVVSEIFTEIPELQSIHIKR